MVQGSNCNPKGHEKEKEGLDETKIVSLVTRAFDGLLRFAREIKLVEETIGVSLGGGASNA